MPTSVYFNNYNSLAEQRVVEDLIVESIKIMGYDAYYLPNDNDQARDLLYGEDPVKKFESAFPIEFYLSSALEYTGEKEFFSKFGLEIKNNASVIVSKRSFTQRVPQDILTRPREGDLVYVPFLNGTGELFEIKFTNQTKDFFMLGRKIPYFYELELEKFKFSQEIIQTGNIDIDGIVSQDAYIIDVAVGAGTGTYQNQEVVFQAPDNTYANASVVAIVQAWSPLANVIAISNIAGEISNNSTLIGLSSNAQYVLAGYDPLNINVNNEQYDNQYIQGQAEGIIDFSESNPFGNI